MTEAHTYETVADWLSEGRKIAQRRSRLQWAIGDWLLAGVDWDGDMSQAAEILDYSTAHLYKMRQTAETFPPDMRSSDLSWTTHARIATADIRHEQKLDIFAQATRQAWTSRDVERVVREATQALDDAGRERTGHPDGYQHVQVQCPQCAHVFEVRGHKVRR